MTDRVGENRQTRGRKITPAFRLAFCALMAALGTAFMLTGNLIPVFTYVSPMLASLTLIPVLYEFGKKYAWMTWFVTATLAMMLCADREEAFFFLFIGYYPIIKPALDRIPAKTIRVLVKLLVFALAFGIMLLILAFVLGLEDIRGELWLSVAVYGMLTAIMLMFDRVYGRMTLIYEKRFRGKLMK